MINKVLSSSHSGNSLSDSGSNNNTRSTSSSENPSPTNSVSRRSSSSSSSSASSITTFNGNQSQNTQSSSSTTNSPSLRERISRYFSCYSSNTADETKLFLPDRSLKHYFFKKEFAYGVLTTKDILNRLHTVINSIDKNNKYSLDILCREIQNMTSIDDVFHNKQFLQACNSLISTIKICIAPNNVLDKPKHIIPISIFSEMHIQKLQSSDEYKELYQLMEQSSYDDKNPTIMETMLSLICSYKSTIEQVKNILCCCLEQEKEDLIENEDIALYMILSLLPSNSIIEDNMLAQLAKHINHRLEEKQYSHLSLLLNDLYSFIDDIIKNPQEYGHSLPDVPWVPLFQDNIIAPKNIFNQSGGYCFLTSIAMIWFTQKYGSEIAKTKMQMLYDEIYVLRMLPATKSLPYYYALQAMNDFLSITGYRFATMVGNTEFPTEDMYIRNKNTQLHLKEILDSLYNPNFCSYTSNFLLNIDKHVFSISRKFEEIPGSNTKKTIFQLFDANTGIFTTDSRIIIEKLFTRKYSDKTFRIEVITLDGLNALEAYELHDSFSMRDFLYGDILALDIVKKIPSSIEEEIFYYTVFKKVKIPSNNKILSYTKSLQKNLKLFNKMLVDKGELPIIPILASSERLTQRKFDELLKNPEDLAYHLKPVLEPMFKTIFTICKQDDEINHLDSIRVNLLENLKEIQNKIEEYEKKSYQYLSPFDKDITMNDIYSRLDNYLVSCSQAIKNCNDTLSLNQLELLDENDSSFNIKMLGEAIEKYLNNNISFKEVSRILLTMMEATYKKCTEMKKYPSIQNNMRVLDDIFEIIEETLISIENDKNNQKYYASKQIKVNLDQSAIDKLNEKLYSPKNMTIYSRKL